MYCIVLNFIITLHRLKERHDDEIVLKRDLLKKTDSLKLN